MGTVPSIPFILLIFYDQLPDFASHILPEYIAGTMAAGLSLQANTLQFLVINKLFLIIAGIGLLYSLHFLKMSGLKAPLNSKI